MIIAQLIEKDDTLLDYFRKKIQPVHSSQFHDTVWLKGIIQDALSTQSECYMVIDGLDECEPDQQRIALDWLIGVAMHDFELTEIRIKLLISGQRNGILDQRLSASDTTLDVTGLRLDGQTSHVQDIAMFASRQIARIRSKFSSIDGEDWIWKALDPKEISAASNGA